MKNSGKSKKIAWLTIVLFTFSMFFSSITSVSAISETKPFSQSSNLTYQGILPQVSQATLNNDMKAYYDSWKSSFLRQASYDSTHYKILCSTTSDRCITEEQGYGMVAVVTMAGYDANAKVIFDGLNNFRKHFIASGSDYCMQWEIYDEAKSTAGVAIDGDMDMAIALLMAYQQWGDQSYLDDARNIIREFEDRYIREDGSIRSGNFEWTSDATTTAICTRTSDFMLAYFPIYKAATGNPIWDKVKTFALDQLESVQANASPNTGLIPEYIVRDSNGNWAAATDKMADANDAKDWSWNAVRDPWRIGFDYLYNNNTCAKNIAAKMGNYLYTNSGDNADNIRSCISMDGANGGGNNLIFTACAGPAAMAAGKQTLLNSIYNKVKTWHDGNYYSESVELMNMLVMTKNCWLPSNLPSITSPASTTNIVLNPGFENSERWSIQDTSQSISSQDKNSGSYSLKTVQTLAV